MNEKTQNPEKRKVIVYVDGFNLYFALKEKGWLGFMWLDMLKLGHALLAENQELVRVKYFTSRIRNDPEKQKRQNLYLDAQGTLDPEKFKIYYGDYQSNPVECWECKKTFYEDREKQTDVNIAVHMVVDAASRDDGNNPIVDDLILITADSDQCPSVKAARAMKKNVLVVLPPGRGDYLELQRVATSKLELTAKKLKRCRLPDKIITGSGYVIECISKWRND